MCSETRSIWPLTIKKGLTLLLSKDNSSIAMHVWGLNVAGCRSTEATWCLRRWDLIQMASVTE